ncbi:hypothetical protein MKZ38_004251 [Zalerion maritima]|uniref:Tafazzin family protein n=1 Tax=Zalerion maritima TaxID=339359 RepID=A0AAD5RLQ8_9PEZI|nr:hypothetical protein MKZ38_004251 [Zalerion maritima]
MSANPLPTSNPGSRPSLPWRLGSTALMGATGAISRTLLYGFNDVEVIGLPGFMELLDRRKSVKDRKRGLITDSMIPSSGGFCRCDTASSRITTGGVLELTICVLRTSMFGPPPNLKRAFVPCSSRVVQIIDNQSSIRFLSTFFSLGQVLPTHRILHSSHGGLFQPTMTQAIRLLSSQPFAPSFLARPSFVSHESHFTTNGIDIHLAPSEDLDRKHSWVHAFPEGFVHQHRSLDMRYFKWGVSRMILESEPGPELVPMFINGTQKIMPEDRTFPRFLPRMGNKVTVAFGESIDTESAFGDLRGRWKELVSRHCGRTEGEGAVTIGSLDNAPQELKYGPEATALRIETTRRVRDEVSKLRRRLGHPDEDPSFAFAETWANEGAKPKYKSEVDGSLVRKK